MNPFVFDNLKIVIFLDISLSELRLSRAKIFQRDHVNVVDMDSMVKLMRSNNFKTDPFSKCDGCDPPYSAENAISSRCDLNPSDGTYPISNLGHRLFGAVDMKVTDSELVKKLQASHKQKAQ